MSLIRMPAPEPRRRLESWKQIAAYLERTVRSVQRWEEREGLPVHRHLHEEAGNVYAYSDELDRWLAERQAKPLEFSAAKPRNRFRIAAVILAVLALTGGIWWAASRTPEPQSPVWLIVTATENRTGQPLLDETIPFLLEREISASSNVHVAPRIRVEDTLRLMRKEPGTRVDEALAREVSLRDGGIDLVVGNRAERLGSTYLLSVTVTEAASGRLVKAASEEARTLEEVPRAVRTMAGVVRRVAGDRLSGGKTELARVTTPSLRACQLYSRAYQEGLRDNWPIAEKLLREALSEDPRFASAHLWLAWSLRNGDRPRRSEWEASLGEAVALADSATDRERKFIMASQLNLSGRAQEAVFAYRRMLDAYPDDYWARNHLAGALSSLGGIKEAASEVYRLAELRPNDGFALRRAVFSAVQVNEVERARQFDSRLRHLIESNPLNVPSELQQFAADFHLHELWLGDKLEEMRAAVDRMAATPEIVTQRLGRGSVVSRYECLGRLRDVEAFIRGIAYPPREFYGMRLAYLQDDNEAVRRALLRSQKIPDQTLQSILSVGKGWGPPEIEKSSAPSWMFPMLEMRAAALNGDLTDAAQKRELARRSVGVGWRGWLVAEMGVARAFEESGDPQSALKILEQADIGRAPNLMGDGMTSAGFWHRVRYERARLCRKLGRVTEAAQIEAELLRDLRLADSDHPLLVRLRESDRRPMNVY